jgi:hypothetical protein
MCLRIVHRSILVALASGSEHCQNAVSLAGGGSSGWIGVDDPNGWGDFFSSLVFGLHAVLRTNVTLLFLDGFFWQGAGQWPWSLLPFPKTSSAVPLLAKMRQRGFSSGSETIIDTLPDRLSSRRIDTPQELNGLGVKLHEYLKAAARSCGRWYRVNTGQRSCGGGHYCHAHLPGAWEHATTSTLFINALANSKTLGAYRSTQQRRREQGEPALVVWQLRGSFGRPRAQRALERMVQKINESILVPGLARRGATHLVIAPAGDANTNRTVLFGHVLQHWLPAHAEQLFLTMATADVLITFGSAAGMGAATVAATGEQLHLFLPPKEVQSRNKIMLRADTAFQTFFVSRNCVPCDASGTPFDEYAEKLAEMLSAIDARRVASSEVATRHFESWLRETELWAHNGMPGADGGAEGSADGGAEGAADGSMAPCRNLCTACASRYDTQRTKPRAKFDILTDSTSTHADELPTFYLHDQGAFGNFTRGVAAEWAELLAGEPPDTALPVLDKAATAALKRAASSAGKGALGPHAMYRAARFRNLESAATASGWGQYLVDLPLLEALARHPRRIRDDPSRAQLHILGVAPLASLVLADGLHGNVQEHSRRMVAAAKELAQLPHYGCDQPNRPCDGEAPIIVLVPGEYIGVLGVEFQNMLLRRRRPVLAVNDQSLAWCCNNGMAKNVPVRHLVETGIVLPYRSHAFAYSAFHRVRRGLMFHGRQFTFDFGLRKRMVEAMQAVAAGMGSHKDGKGPAPAPVDLRTSSKPSVAGTMHGPGPGRMERSALAAAIIENYVESGRAYRSASMCMSPSGDVITSRRVFDALSAGCVPVLVRASYIIKRENQFASQPRDHTFYSSLPFSRSIDWEAVTLRFVPDSKMMRPQPCTKGDAAWLQAWHHQLNVSDFSLGHGASIRERGHAAYRAHLDYERNPMGIASALLREAADRIGSPIVRDIGNV